MKKVRKHFSGRNYLMTKKGAEFGSLFLSLGQALGFYSYERITLPSAKRMSVIFAATHSGDKTGFPPRCQA